jgi:Tol biopolymer transport system component
MTPFGIHRLIRSALLLLAGVPLAFGVGAPLCAEDPLREPLITVPLKSGEKYQLALVNLSGRVVGKVMESDEQLLEPAWSPDGTRLLYITVEGGFPQLFLKDASAVPPKPDVNLTKSTTIERNPAWSPDGKQICWVHMEGNEHVVWTMNADGTGGNRISDASIMHSNPTWSADGKTIAYSTNRPGDGNFRLWQMNVDGSDVRELYKEILIRVVYPAWSPDGKQILFGGSGGGPRVQLCICNANGEGFAQLTQNDKQCSFASWSPDGQYVAYVAFDRWPGGYSPWEVTADNACPPGDLMLYDTLSGEHKKLITGALPMYGPRPSWRKQAEN